MICVLYMTSSGVVRFGLGLLVEMPAHLLDVERALPAGETTTVATPLPIRLVSARASDMKRSTPRISAMLATGMVPTEDKVAASTMKPEPVTPAAPFEVKSRMAMMPSCWAKLSSVFGRLRQEQRGHGEIDAGAVEVEGVARRDHEADHRLLAAEILHLRDHSRQHQFRRRGAEHDEQLLLDVADELEDVEAGEPGNGAKHERR